jgi:hypothetical protein
MIDLKPIKYPREHSKFYLWWIETSLSRWYYDFTWKFFGNPIFQVKRLYQWYVNVFRNDYDFDAHCLFAIIEYKLNRVEKSLLNGLAWQEDRDMKALKLAIKLAGRLKDDKYEEVAWARMDKKWGEIQIDWKAQPISSRSKVKTEEDNNLMWADRLKQYELSEKRKKRDERNLYVILHKYINKWWD